MIYKLKAEGKRREVISTLYKYKVLRQALEREISGPETTEAATGFKAAFSIWSLMMTEMNCARNECLYNGICVVYLSLSFLALDGPFSVVNIYWSLICVLFCNELFLVLEYCS